MRSIHKFKRITLPLIAIILSLSVYGFASEPKELVKLRDSFNSARQMVQNEGQRKDLINKYIEDLTALATEMRIYRHDIESTNSVRQEIRRAKEELIADPTLAVKSSPEQMEEAVPPVVKKSEMPTVQAPVSTLIPAVPVATDAIMKPETNKIVEVDSGMAPPPESQPEVIIHEKVADNPLTVPESKKITAPVDSAMVAPEPVSKMALSEKLSPATTPEPVAKKAAPKPAAIKPEPVAQMNKKDQPKPLVKMVEPVVIAEPEPVGKMPEAKPVVKKSEPKKVEAETKPVVTNAAPPPPVAAPKPEPAEEKEHIPKTHVSSVEGVAGKTELNSNNVYSFDLSAIGTSTILAFWATGRDSIATYGKVWLVTPDNRRVIVGIWKESYFEFPASEVSSYYKLKPITEDITKKVTKPGIYKVEFEWTDGKTPLIIYRVEITS